MLATDVIVAIEIGQQGVFEIHTLLDKLAASYQFEGQSSEWLLPLHSSIASTHQEKVFLRPPNNIHMVKPFVLVLKILMSLYTCSFVFLSLFFFCICLFVDKKGV